MHCYLSFPLWGFYVRSLFCFVVRFSFAIMSLGKRVLVALPLLRFESHVVFILFFDSSSRCHG